MVQGRMCNTYMPAHVVALSLGPSKASALPMLHALRGSDAVSFFRNRGKKSAWDVWNVFPELTLALCALKASPEIIMEESLAVLERFVVLLYDRTSSLLKVNEARQELFCKKSREFDSIPQTCITEAKGLSSLVIISISAITRSWIFFSQTLQ